MDRITVISIKMYNVYILERNIMCTAATYKTKDSYFGRTLDYEFSYHEEVTITPRFYPFHFANKRDLNQHYAMIGTAYVVDHYPLYYDAVNEKGLGMCGLNFVGNAVYKDPIPGKDNIASFEFIPWILCQCSNVGEARELIEKMNLINVAFHEDLPPAELHWMISDKLESITVEAVETGIKIYDNPVGILTNNPPFEQQLFRLNNYMGLSKREPVNYFAPTLKLEAYSRGMGALGLPGDLSSESRFVRAAFTKMNSISNETENESVSQFFHILNSVEQPRGCCVVEPHQYEITIYTSCCNLNKGIYYYTTYDNHQITSIDMHHENLNHDKLIQYPFIKEEQILRQN